MRAVEELGDLPVMSAIDALLAERFAAAVDRAVARGDEVAMSRAAEKLTAALGRLGIGGDQGKGKTDGSEGGGSSDGADERGRGFLTLIDGDPQVGDASNA